MKKYKVKFYVVDYVEKEFEVEAHDKQEAESIARELSNDGQGEFMLVYWKENKKPSVTVVK